MLISGKGVPIVESTEIFDANYFTYAVPEDVRTLRHAVLRHRLHLSFEALADRVAPETVVDAVFDAVPTP